MAIFEIYTTLCILAAGRSAANAQTGKMRDQAGRSNARRPPRSESGAGHFSKKNIFMQHIEEKIGTLDYLKPKNRATLRHSFTTKKRT